MTADKKQRLINKLAETYDIAKAAKSAGISVGEARGVIEGALSEVDSAVLHRILGTSAELTRKAIEEFSSIAFSDADDYKISDKIKAIEQLLKLVPQDGQDVTEPLTVVYDYR